MKKVLIIANTSRIVGRQLLSGAERYISAFARWEVHTQPPEYLADSKKQLYRQDIQSFDGFFVCDARNISQILAVAKPKVVHYSHKEDIPGASSIITNSDNIGKMVADYFLSLGFKNFAYCGFHKLPWSDRRFKNFSLYLLQKNISNIFEYNIQPSSQIDQRVQIAQWLKSLPRPVCVFACNDDRAVNLLEACKLGHLNVPEEVAVIGVDNDELMCNLSSPPLSSVLLDFEKAGFDAAKQLDQLMSGKRHDKVIIVEPLEIVKRRSTDVLATEDKEVISALIFIRSNFDKPIQVNDVVTATNLSRRELEYRFGHYLRKTVKAEINRLRVEHIRKKLLNSDESIHTIARELSFTDTEHFSRYFKGLTGLTPLQFRSKFKANSVL